MKFFGHEFEMSDLEYSGLLRDMDLIATLQSNQRLRGDNVKSLEETLGRVLGSPGCMLEALVCGSATDALFMLLRSAGLKDGARVAVGDMSFVASAGAVKRAGYTPVFVDVDEYGIIDLKKLESSQFDALVIVQLYGAEANGKVVAKICEDRNAPIIEDAAQRHAPSAELIHSSVYIGSALSFDPTKLMSGVSSGGAVISTRKHVIEAVKKLRYHGHYNGTVGGNSQLPEVSAKVIQAKISRLPAWQAKKTQLAEHYLGHLDQIPKVRALVKESSLKSHHLHKFVVCFDTPRLRDQVMAHLTTLGLPALVHYKQPLSTLEMFGGASHPVGHVATYLCDRVLTLPLHAGISLADVDLVCRSIREICVRS